MRRGQLVAALALLAAAPAVARAQPETKQPESEQPAEQPAEQPIDEQPAEYPIADGPPDQPPEEAPAEEKPDEQPDEPDEPKRPAASDRELAGSLGLDLGGRVTPGGLHIAGAYLYQLSDVDWFDGGLSFTFGSGQAGCFRDRDNDYLCDHALVRGFGAEVFGGVRRYFPGQGRFTPYGRAALGLRLVSFGADDVRGLAVPLQLGGGVRASVNERIALSGGAELRLGPAWFNRELEDQPHLGLAVHAGIEFEL
jgi:hypothetical protein